MNFKSPDSRGFTLIELMIVLVIVGILAMVAYPSYQQHIVRASREAAQGELLELAALQERIFLNSNAYTSNLTGAYTGQSTGGLGRTSGSTGDGKYSLGVTAAGLTFTLTATPVSGNTQAGDGNLTISADGTRTWGSKTW